YSCRRRGLRRRRPAHGPARACHLRGPDARRRRGLRPDARGAQGQAWSQAQEGTETAWPQGGGQEGGRKQERRGIVAVAGGEGHGLRSETLVAGAVLRGGVAGGAWAEAYSYRDRARPGRKDAGRLPVHDRRECLGGVGGGNVRQKVVDRGGVQGEQTGDGHRGAAALVPPEHKQVGAVGVVDAKRAPGLVSDGRARFARGSRGTRPDGGVGQRMLAPPHAPGLPPGHLERHYFRQVGPGHRLLALAPGPQKPDPHSCLVAGNRCPAAWKTPSLTGKRQCGPADPAPENLRTFSYLLYLYYTPYRVVRQSLANGPVPGLRPSSL